MKTEDQSAWTTEARVTLIETAKRYHAVITYGELAERIQERTGVRTKQLLQNWIGEPLARVAYDCASRGEPLLAALCVSKLDGTVGPGYAESVEATYGSLPADLQAHAAAERLKCYRHFEAVGLPTSGGVPALTPQVANARRRKTDKDLTQRRILAAESRCPTCYQVPALSGVCGCD